MKPVRHHHLRVATAAASFGAMLLCTVRVRAPSGTRVRVRAKFNGNAQLRARSAKPVSTRIR